MRNAFKFFATLDIPVILGIFSMHLLVIPAVYYRSWPAVGIFFALYFVTGSFGIGVCYHRLLTHRGFETFRWLKYLLTIIGTLAWQGPPMKWIPNHVLHHQHSDTAKDPHSPKRGFWWAHWRWLFFKRPDGVDPRICVPDLVKDRGIYWIDKFFWVPQLVVANLLFWVGWWCQDLFTAMAWLCWGIGVRTVVTYHVTWFVNSASHTWGSRPRITPDRSTNLWWVAFLAFGEGWHNDHHAFPMSARHGLRWWQLDINWIIIWLLVRARLAWNVKLPTQGQIAAKTKAAKPALASQMPAL